MNYRHPGPRRVEGGSGLQSMPPDCRERRETPIVPGGLLLSNAHALSAYWQVQDSQNDKKTSKTTVFGIKC